MNVNSALWVGSIHSIKNFQDHKKFRPRFCSNYSKTLWICLRQVKKTEIHIKNFRLIFVKNVVVINEKHERGDCESWNFAQRPIRPFSSKDFKTTIFTVAPFMAQISPKYYHSLQQQNHITFNSSEYLKHIFPPACYKSHWLHGWCCLNSTSPQIHIQSESYIYDWRIYPNLLIWNNCFLKYGGPGANISNTVLKSG